MSATLELGTVDETAGAAGMTHVVCDCNQDIALCGKDVSDRPFTEKEPSCNVCAAMEYDPCPRCGA